MTISKEDNNWIDKVQKVIENMTFDVSSGEPLTSSLNDVSKTDIYPLNNHKIIHYTKQMGLSICASCGASKSAPNKDVWVALRTTWLQEDPYFIRCIEALKGKWDSSKSPVIFVNSPNFSQGINLFALRKNLLDIYEKTVARSEIAKKIIVLLSEIENSTIMKQYDEVLTVLKAIYNETYGKLPNSACKDALKQTLAMLYEQS
jgi:hypothetical protein